MLSAFFYVKNSLNQTYIDTLIFWMIWYKKIYSNFKQLNFQ